MLTRQVASNASEFQSPEQSETQIPPGGPQRMRGQLTNADRIYRLNNVSRNLNDMFDDAAAADDAAASASAAAAAAATAVTTTLVPDGK